MLGDLGDIVEDQQLVLVELGDGGLEPQLPARHLQPLDEVCGAHEQHALTALNESQTGCCRKMALAPAGRAKEQDIGTLIKPAVSEGERHDLRLVDYRHGVEVKGVERLARRQSRAGEMPLDRTYDRLTRLFHAGYLDRPHAQLDYYPTSGSAPMVYALTDRGARLLIERYGIEFANVEWSRKNRKAGRPFIEHQLAIVDFNVTLQLATRGRADVHLVYPDEMAASFPDQKFSRRNPFAMRVSISHQGTVHAIAVVPDIVFGLAFPDGSRHCFMVEIDRGTMPILRKDFMQTSFERKMRAYLTAHAAKQHERQFGWNTFRVLTITTDHHRSHSMKEALRQMHVPHSMGTSLFLFATRDELRTSDPITHAWKDAKGRDVRLL